MKTKQRSLAVLLAMVLVLGGLLWLITRSNAAEEAASSAAAEGSIVLSSFAAGDAEQIRYTYQNETITRAIIWMHLPATPWSQRWHP